MNHHASPHTSSSEAAELAALYARLRGAMARRSDPSPRTSIRLVVASTVVPLLCASILVIASRIVYGREAPGLEVGAHATSQLLIVLALVVGLTLASTSVAVWRGGDGLGPGVVALTLVVALAAPAYALLVLLSPVHAPDPVVASVEISPWGVRCLLISTIVGSGVLASLIAALRHAVPFATRLRGAALGAAAGIWAGLTVFMFCTSDELKHILVGHVLPIAAFTVLGGLVAPRWVKA